MSAKKKSAGRMAKRAKPAKSPKKRAKVARAAKAKAGATKLRAAAKKRTKKPVARKAAARKPAAKKVVAKKIVAKKAVAKMPVTAVARAPKPNGKPAPIKRRDGAGHLDPKYAADLRARSTRRPKDNEQAFAKDALSEELGEEFVETVTSGEDEGNEIRDQRVTEELGGPFTVTSAGTEFGSDVDASNPKGATREPFPRT